MIIIIPIVSAYDDHCIIKTIIDIKRRDEFRVSIERITIMRE